MTEIHLPYDGWECEVNNLFISRYGVSWAGLCGDEEPLRNAYDRNESPGDFVERWAVKYDLDPIEGPFKKPISRRI